MNPFNTQFHHFGLAVRAPDQATAYLSILGYMAGAMEYVPLQGVNVTPWHHAVMPDVEVVRPLERPSPIDGIIMFGDRSFDWRVWTYRTCTRRVLIFCD